MNKRELLYFLFSDNIGKFNHEVRALNHRHALRVARSEFGIKVPLRSMRTTVTMRGDLWEYSSSTGYECVLIKPHECTTHDGVTK